MRAARPHELSTFQTFSPPPGPCPTRCEVLGTPDQELAPIDAVAHLPTCDGRAGRATPIVDRSRRTGRHRISSRPCRRSTGSGQFGRHARSERPEPKMSQVRNSLCTRTRTPMSRASEKGPPVCHELGTTSAVAGRVLHGWPWRAGRSTLLGGFVGRGAAGGDGFLALPVALAFDDELVGGRLEPVDGGLGQ